MKDFRNRPTNNNFSSAAQPRTESEPSAILRIENAQLSAELRRRDELINTLRNELESLKADYNQLLENTNSKVHNERGAGRKSKITAEIAGEVLRLRQEGYSLADISNIYAENTGVFISKSTVNKIINTWSFD